jgi:hypothetical protein
VNHVRQTICDKTRRFPTAPASPDFRAVSVAVLGTNEFEAAEMANGVFDAPPSVVQALLQNHVSAGPRRAA